MATHTASLNRIGKYPTILIGETSGKFPTYLLKRYWENPPLLSHEKYKGIPPILMKNIREIPHYPEPKTTTIIS